MGKGDQQSDGTDHEVMEIVANTSPCKVNSLVENIATGETSQAITSFNYYNFYRKITFLTR